MGKECGKPGRIRSSLTLSLFEQGLERRMTTRGCSDSVKEKEKSDKVENMDVILLTENTEIRIRTERSRASEFFSPSFSAGAEVGAERGIGWEASKASNKSI